MCGKCSHIPKCLSSTSQRVTNTRAGLSQPTEKGLKELTMKKPGEGGFLERVVGVGPPPTLRRQIGYSCFSCEAQLGASREPSWEHGMWFPGIWGLRGLEWFKLLVSSLWGQISQSDPWKQRLYLGSTSGSKVFISQGADLDRHGGAEVYFNRDLLQWPTLLICPTLVLKVSCPRKPLSPR